MNGGKIEVEGSYESRDLWRSAVSHYFSLSFIYYFFWAFVIYGFFITFLFLRGGTDVYHFVDIILSSIAFVILYALAMAYLSFGKTREIESGKYKFTFSIEKIEISGLAFVTHLNWDWFIQIKETRHHFILFSKMNEKTLLPKRFFNDSAQLAEFKNLICSKLGEKVYLKKSKENLGLK